MKGEACRDCGRENRRGGDNCAGCHARRYRATDAGRAAVVRAATKWNRTHRPARLAIERRYRERYGLSCPDIIEARRAVKRLDRALAHAAYRP